AGGAQSRIRSLQKLEDRKTISSQVLNAPNGDMHDRDHQQSHDEDEPVFGHGEDQPNEQVEHQRYQKDVKVSPGEILDKREQKAELDVNGECRGGAQTIKVRR